MSHINKEVGILGGGQLARMLCLEGHKMGLVVHVLSENENDPAAQVTKRWHKGRLNNVEDIAKFLRNVDIATIESEFLDEKVLKEAEYLSGKKVLPSSDIVSRFSDRLTQKAWMLENKIPTAKFASLLSKADVENFYNQSTFGVVLKKRRFGYDGYETYIIKNEADLQLWLLKFKDQFEEFIIEEFVPFQRELAVQFAINDKQDVYTLPLVEWHAENAKCLWVKGPIASKKFQPLANKIIKALKQTHFVGVIAFEIFDTRVGFTINEIAPRVHNSAHYSLEGLATNQFRAHLRAVLGLSLPKTSTLQAKGFAMLNLLGTGTQKPKIDPPTDATLHWYGKKENRKGRKMGHVTCLTTSPDEALKKLLKMRKQFVL